MVELVNLKNEGKIINIGIANVTLEELKRATKTWLLMKGDHIIPIPGMDKKEHVVMNFKSLNLSLLRDAMTLDDMLRKRGDNISVDVRAIHLLKLAP